MPSFCKKATCLGFMGILLAKPAEPQIRFLKKETHICQTIKLGASMVITLTQFLGFFFDISHVGPIRVVQTSKIFR